MKLIICIDDNNGISFNSRRQSRDAVLCGYLNTLALPTQLLVSPYSAPLFAEGTVQVVDNPLEAAGPGDVVFVENCDVVPWDSVEELILCRWNRVYPADMHIDVPEYWHVVRHEEFAGKSHPKISVDFMRR